MLLEWNQKTMLRTSNISKSSLNQCLEEEQVKLLILQQQMKI